MRAACTLSSHEWVCKDLVCLFLIIIIISPPHFHIVPVVHQHDLIIFLSHCVSLLMQPTLSSYFCFIFTNFLSYWFLPSIMLKILLLIRFWHLFPQFLLSPCLALLCYTVYSIVEILGIYIHPSLTQSLSIANYTLVMMMKAMFVSWWESSTSSFLSTYLLQSTINLIWCVDELPL